MVTDDAFFQTSISTKSLADYVQFRFFKTDNPHKGFLPVGQDNKDPDDKDEM